MRDPISEYAPALTEGYARAHSSYLQLVQRVGHGLSTLEHGVANDDGRGGHAADIDGVTFVSRCAHCAHVHELAEAHAHAEGATSRLSPLWLWAKGGVLRGLRLGSRVECSTCRFLEYYSQ